MQTFVVGDYIVYRPDPLAEGESGRIIAYDDETGDYDILMADGAEIRACGWQLEPDMTA